MQMDMASIIFAELDIAHCVRMNVTNKLANRTASVPSVCRRKGYKANAPWTEHTEWTGGIKHVTQV